MLPAQCMHYGREVTSFVQDAQGVDVQFGDGHSEQADILIAADGTGSLAGVNVFFPQFTDTPFPNQPALAARPSRINIGTTSGYVLDSANKWVLPWDRTDFTWGTAQDANGQWRVAGPNAQALMLAAAAADRTKIVPAGPSAENTVAVNSSRKIPDVSTLEPGGR